MATVLEHTGVRERETTFLSSIAAGRHLPPTPILFLSLFAAQAALVGLTPILPQVAGELGVSTGSSARSRGWRPGSRPSPWDASPGAWASAICWSGGWVGSGPGH